MNTDGQPSTSHNNCEVISKIEGELSCIMDQLAMLSAPLAQLESTVGDLEQECKSAMDLTRGSEESMGPIKATAYVTNQEPKKKLVLDKEASRRLIFGHLNNSDGNSLPNRKFFGKGNLALPKCVSSALTVEAIHSISSASQSSYTIDKGQLFPSSVFDSHCHLDFTFNRLKHVADYSFEKFLDMAVVDTDSSFGGCVANFCNPADWSKEPSGMLESLVFNKSGKYKRVFLTFGCHPHFADHFLGNSMDSLSELFSCKYLHNNVVALGECGLDYSKKNTVDHALQKEVFQCQLKIALQFQLPLVLHIRDAEADGFKVLEAAGVPHDWPIHRHCFTGDWATADTWLNRYPGSKIGVTGIVTNLKADKVQEMVKHIPLDRLLLETDSPYFLPSGIDRTVYPWDFTLPSHVLHVAARVAFIKGIPLRDVLKQNLKNIQNVYKIGNI